MFSPRFAVVTRKGCQKKRRKYCTAFPCNSRQKWLEIKENVWNGKNFSRLASLGIVRMNGCLCYGQRRKYCTPVQFSNKRSIIQECTWNCKFLQGVVTRKGCHWQRHAAEILSSISMQFPNKRSIRFKKYVHEIEKFFSLASLGGSA